MVEVPSQELLGSLNQGSPCLSPFGVLIDDICSWLPFFIRMYLSLLLVLVVTKLLRLWLQRLRPQI